MGRFSKFMVLAVLSLGLMMSGCAAQMNRGAGGMFSFVTENCPPERAPALAERMADSLTGLFPPGHTTLFVEPASPEAGEDALGAAFDQALRARGFVMATAPSEQALTVAYALDQVDEDIWYTRLSISNGLVLSRTYRLAEGRLTEGAAAMRAGGDYGE